MDVPNIRFVFASVQNSGPKVYSYSDE